MAHREYTNTKPAVASTSKQGSQIRAEANKLIRDNEFEFHEHDIFEVENILLSKMLIRKNFGGEFEEKYYGGIYGEYVHNSRQKTLPTGNSPVLPLDPNIKRYPVPGEYVVLTPFCVGVEPLFAINVLFLNVTESEIYTSPLKLCPLSLFTNKLFPM